MTRRFRNFTALFLTLACLLPLSGCAAAAEKTDVRFAALKGPTGMGIAWLMEEARNKRAANRYEFVLAGAPDALVAKLVTGELDIAALPTNTIALLSQKTGGAVQALAINTLGVLYVVERGETVRSAADLEGKTVVAAGKGTTVEAIASRLFGDKVTVDFVAEHAEAVAQAAAGKYALALLPEPFVTSLTGQNADFRVALDMTALWRESGAGALPMGGIAVRREFAEKNPEAVKAFLAEYAASVAFANEHPEDAAKLIGKFEIMPAAVAEAAIPRSNMVCIAGDEMKQLLAPYFEVLLAENPLLIGGQAPADSFYYAP